MKINKLLTPHNLTHANNPGRIQYIVIHYVGALGGAQGNCQYYASQYIGASAHYYVGFGGEIWQSVEDGDVAWHCGASSYNHPNCRNSNSIGIEMCVRKGSTSSMGATDRDWYFEDATVRNAIELTKTLMHKYGIPASRVIRHYDVTGKICPNPYVYNHTKHTWSAFKAALDGAAQTPTPQPDNGTVYRVQTGAFKDKKLAAALAETLKDNGYDTLISQSGGYHKVQVGAYSVKQNATNIQNNLKRDGYDAYIVTAGYQKWGAKCTGNGVNVRTGAGMGYANVADYPSLNAGNEIDVIGEQVDGTGRKWYKVLIRHVITGFVAAEYVARA